MFVTVIRKGHTAIYECKRVFIRTDVTTEGQVAVRMEDSDVDLIIEKVLSQVYIMNNEGKTIDRYRWPDREDVVPA
ncbi:hypothetical protein LCGC14_1339380 [marine sediment metagenome]|uniref:Uncharacterized protein n=1 Tax=marine sediment metagenome TaxID=412755 RepID=A0A0F9NGE3_9ZZZZ